MCSWQRDDIVRGGANAMAAVIEEDEAVMDPSMQALQQSIGQIGRGLSELRADVRDLRVKQDADTRELRAAIDQKHNALDAKFDSKIDALDAKFDAKIDALDAKFDSKIDALDAKFDTKIDALDAKFDTKIDALDKKLDTKVGELRSEISALRDGVAALGVKLESSLRKMTIWWVLSLGTVLGVLAKGFHWI
jgi:chromosome segregation ATPase